MHRALFLLSILVLASLRAMAQDFGSVSGVVISTWDGASLPSVVITVRGTTLAVQTDQTGRYQLNNVPLGDQVLRMSKPGFASAVVTDVRVVQGQITMVNGNLRPEFFEMEEYEVTAEEFAEQTEKIIFERQQAGSVMEAIGSEQFSRLGAGDAGAIVARATGVSLVGGKFAVVRGLADRYTRTQLNGLEVPSSDPYRTAPQLDLFPSSMIDRINISKTFTPDQPGGSGGGTINIVTKPFPDKPFVKGSFGMSYNPTSNMKGGFFADPATSMNQFDMPQGPTPLESSLWSLQLKAPLPTQAVRSESQTRAEDRRRQADAAQDLLQKQGTTEFAPVLKETPMNTSINISAGETKKLASRPLGIFIGANYARKFQLLDNFTVQKVQGDNVLKEAGTESRSNVGTDYGANVNLGYRLSDNNYVAFNFMLAHSVDEEARSRTSPFLESQPYILEKRQLHYTDREIQNYQLHGDHDLPHLFDSKLEWAGSLATAAQDEPNHRFLNYFVEKDTGVGHVSDNALPIPFNPSRYYRSIGDDARNFRLDWTLPLEVLSQETKFKIGLMSSSMERDFKEQYFGYVFGNPAEVFNPGNPNAYLSDPDFLIYEAMRLANSARGTNYSFRRFVDLVIGRPYTASQDVLAGYPMLDVGVTSWLRLIGGVRIEQTTMHIDTRDSGSSSIDQTDLLPSAGAVLTIVTNLNIRLSYGETLARPSFREKAPIANYLPDMDLFAAGNPDLTISYIRSYDARIEWFPNPGEIFSAGIFYKAIDKPIELGNVDIDDNVTWFNRKQGTVSGLEFEARKSLEVLSDDLKGLTLGANIAIIKSETPYTSDEYNNKQNAIPGLGLSRSLYDQSPYIMNFDMTYDLQRSGTTLTLGANFTGERIILVNAQGHDTYEHSPISLDVLLSQKISNHWSLRFGVRNLLNPEYRQTFGEDFDSPIKYSYRRGRTFQLSISAEY